MRIISRLAIAGAALLGMSTLAFALVRIEVDLTSQTLHAEGEAGESHDWPISSGRAGHLTPTGRFRPQRLFTMVHSLKYDNAPMPHAIFFTGPYAIHATNAVRSLGRPASHGCIRLAPGAASTLFTMVKAEGATISIVGVTPGGRDRTAARADRRNRFAFAYAPRRHGRSLREWVADPLVER